jgi:hypothetical protein
MRPLLLAAWLFAASVASAQTFQASEFGPSGTALEIPAGVTLDLTRAELRLIENDRRGYQAVLFTGRGKPSALVGRHGWRVGNVHQRAGRRRCGHPGHQGLRLLGDGTHVGAAAGGDPSPARWITIEDVEAGHNRRNNISVVAAYINSATDVTLGRVTFSRHSCGDPADAHRPSLQREACEVTPIRGWSAVP